MLTLLRQVTEQAPAPLHLRDRDLENVALRCLEKAPADRYGSAAELADDLERWLRGEPVKARPVGVGVHFLKWMRRRPAHAALAGFVVAGAVALSFFLRSNGRDSEVIRPAVIVVENASFELPDLGHDIALIPRHTTETPPGWTAAENNHGGTAVGVHDPCDILYRGTNGPVLPGTADGAQTCYMNLGSGEANTLTYAGFSLGHFVEGQTYTLTVAVGGRRDGGAPASAIGIALLAGGKPAGAGATAPAVADRFFDLRGVFTATAAEGGKPIGIQISARNASTGFQQANIDNVRLTTTRPRNLPVTASRHPEKVAARRALEWLHRVNGPRGYVILQAEDGQLQRVKTGEPLPPGDFEISELWLDHWKAANERDLKFPPIDPADFRKHAATLKKLQMCFLRSLDLGADDLAFLSQNPDLTYLTIENIPGGGDPLIPHLAQLEKLLLLNVSRFEGAGEILTGQKLGTLACLPNLTRAYFTSSALEDADVAMLVERCAQLRDIGLGGTRITDAGLTELAKIPSLNSLFLYGAENVTAVGVAAFQQAHPECKIAR